MLSLRKVAKSRFIKWLQSINLPQNSAETVKGVNINNNIEPLSNNKEIISLTKEIKKYLFYYTLFSFFYQFPFFVSARLRMALYTTKSARIATRIIELAPEVERGMFDYSLESYDDAFTEYMRLRELRQEAIVTAQPEKQSASKQDYEEKKKENAKRRSEEKKKERAESPLPVSFIF